MNGLHTFFPSVPHIPRDFWLNHYLSERPWSALRPFQVVIFWSMVGFSYLLTLEVSFSIWFFFVFYKLQCLIGVILGFQLTSGPGVQWTGKSFSAAQEAGACLVFVAIALWKTRHHIKNMFQFRQSDEAITVRGNCLRTHRWCLCAGVFQSSDGYVNTVCNRFCVVSACYVCRFDVAGN